MSADAICIDSEFLLFAELWEYKHEIPNLIFHMQQYNDRHKNRFIPVQYSEEDGGWEWTKVEFISALIRSPWRHVVFPFHNCSMGKKEFEEAPSIGYRASQGMYYYGNKPHAVCGLSGIIHPFDLANGVHDIR